MTPAELKTLRESLGLSVNWLAVRAGVSVRSAQYWESGERTVPADIEEILIGIDLMIETFVEKTLDHLKIELKEYPDSDFEFTILRYREDEDLWRFHPKWEPLPAACHAAMIARLRRELARLDVESRVVYMEPVKYSLWLKENGKIDSEQSRTAWALHQ